MLALKVTASVFLVADSLETHERKWDASPDPSAASAAWKAIFAHPNIPNSIMAAPLLAIRFRATEHGCTDAPIRIVPVTDMQRMRESCGDGRGLLREQSTSVHQICHTGCKMQQHYLQQSQLAHEAFAHDSASYLVG